MVSNKAVLREQAATFEGEDDRMDWQEKYFKKIEEGIADLKTALLRLEDKFNARFEQSENKINARFEQSENKVNARFEQSENKVNARFEQSENKVNARFEQSENKINARFEQSENRFENRLQQTETRLEKYIGERDAQRHQEFLALNQRMDEMNKWIIALVVTMILGIVGLVTGWLPLKG